MQAAVYCCSPVVSFSCVICLPPSRVVFLRRLPAATLPCAGYDRRLPGRQARGALAAFTGSTGARRVTR
jgi:hypothetical protein